MPQTTLFNAPQPLRPTLTAPPTKKPRFKSSPLWAYAADLDADGNAPYSQAPGREKISVFRCKLCIVNGERIKEYEAPRSGAHFRDHL